LKGELNKDTHVDIKENLKSIIKENGIKYLVFNLEEINYIDSYGIMSLINNYEVIKKNSGRVLICGISDKRLKRIITKEKNLDEATSELNAIQKILVGEM